MSDTNEPAVSNRALADMRDVLEELGFAGAQTAPRENVIDKIRKSYNGGVQGFLTQYGH